LNRTTRLGPQGPSQEQTLDHRTEQFATAVTQLDKANSFRALHKGTRAFVIPNVWDAGSARVLAGLGFAALATSSGASAWAYGRRDGGITLDQALAHARAIIDATDLPVSADLEHGFGATVNDVAETYRHAVAVGLVGATIEDLRPTPRTDKPLFDIGEATERVAAAVAATRNLGFPFMLTARAEGFRYGNTDLDDAIKRLQAFEKAGADVLMAPGLPDLASVKAVCAAITRPFNFMAGIPGKSFTVAELDAAGVRRINLAGSLYRAAASGLVAAARELKDKGTLNYVDTSLPSADVAGFMRE
jgi:2-methylisocitrate lyase-like PEP mutase family enzyme